MAPGSSARTALIIDGRRSLLPRLLPQELDGELNSELARRYLPLAPAQCSASRKQHYQASDE